MEVFIFLGLIVTIGTPVLLIWGLIELVQWANAKIGQDSEARGTKCPRCGRFITPVGETNECPHCKPLVIPYYIKTQLEQLEQVKRRIYFWHSLGKISAEELNRLDTLYNEDRRELLSKFAKETVGPQESSFADDEVKPEIPIVHEVSPQIGSIEELRPEPTPSKFKPATTVAKTAFDNSTEKQSSAFLSERNIKLLLYIGVSLFALGASIFVRNTWDIIPDILKFASLLFITLGVYLTGFFLIKNNKILRTATGLVFLGSLLIPLNFFAANNFALLGFRTDWRQVGLVSSMVCLPLYIFNCRLLLSRAFFYGSLAAYSCIILFGSSLFGMPSIYYPAILLIFCAMLPLFVVGYLQENGCLSMNTSLFDTHVFVNVIGFVSFIQLISFGVAKTNDIWTSIGIFLLGGFYMIDSLIVDERRILYASGIAFYTALLVFIRYFNQPFLNVVAQISTFIIFVELFFRYVSIAGREDEFFKPFNTISQIVASVIAVGIFSLEIVRFIATYFFDYNITSSVVYQLRTIIWITAVGLVYFILLQVREQKKIYSYIIISYFYILGFIMMQLTMNVTHHAYGFMTMGALALIMQSYLSQRTSNEALFMPLKSFSYLFTIFMAMYLIMRYVVSAHSPEGYLLALIRTGGLLSYFGLSFYLYRERLMVYILSFLFYLASFIIVSNFMGLSQHALFFSLATLPIFGLYWLYRESEFGYDLLRIQIIGLTISFCFSLFKGFYIFPEVVTRGGYYFYNLVSLGIILTIILIHEFTIKEKSLAYVSGILFYLIIFVLVYPHMSLQTLGIVMTYSCLVGGCISLLLSRKDDFAELGAPLSLVSNGVQFVVIGSVFRTVFIQSALRLSGFSLMAYIIAAGLYAVVFIFNEKDIYGYIAQLLFGLTYFSLLDYVPNSANYWPYHLLVLNVIYIGWGRFCSVFKEDVNTQPFRYMGLITMILALLFSLQHLHYAYVIFGIYAILCFVWSRWQEQQPFWQNFAYNLLLAAYELMLYSLNVKTVEFYTVPLGLALLTWGIVCHEHVERRKLFFTFGVLVIYLPGFFASMSETWGLHGVFLGSISLILLFAGIKLRSKIIVVYSATVLVVNGVIQAYGYMCTIPRWVYMAAGGTLLIVSSMLFEMKREALLQMGRNLAEKWKDW